MVEINNRATFQARRTIELVPLVAGACSSPAKDATKAWIEKRADEDLVS
jgi:hypothetical protein